MHFRMEGRDHLIPPDQTKVADYPSRIMLRWLPVLAALATAGRPARVWTQPVSPPPYRTVETR